MREPSDTRGCLRVVGLPRSSSAVRPAMGALAAFLAAAVLMSGCYTGGGMASSYLPQVQVGMTYREVGERLGEPDEVAPWMKGGQLVPGVEWRYLYHTPFTMWIVPSILFFTVVLSFPALYWMLGLGMSGTGIIWVRFGPDGRVLEMDGVLGTSL